MKRTTLGRSRSQTFRPVTLAQMAEQSLNVLVWCNGCHHNDVVSWRVLMGRLGPHCPVPAVGRRMVCSVCGGRDVATRPDWPKVGVVTSHEGAGND